jgi:proteasome lid subunit RPN8/RPN11
MRWIEESPRLPLQPLGALAARVPAMASIATQRADAPGLWIAVAADAHAAALAHLAGARTERGGLLLGEVFADGEDVACSRAVLVTQAVAAEEFSGTGTSLRMSSDVWEHARRRLAALELVVGWFHSHPGLGAFFSATDRRTQRAFFPNPYCVGWVVDPAGHESAWFVGGESAPPGRVLYCVGGPGRESRNGGAPTTSTRSTK